MAQCYHRQSCISVYWVIPNPRPWHGYFHVHLQLRECSVRLSSNNFCSAINNKLNLSMNHGTRQEEADDNGAGQSLFAEFDI